METLHLKAMNENAVTEIKKAAEILKNGGFDFQSRRMCIR